ncbi:Predicted Fe2+/Mn2+ transporter, VIT1/CCC1 family [Spirosomataceae bacterium TFI 002]|nr:Predicted Fe2+/Mn2+ transporter, VIT1/CCC1 family [Spirosomataceae bacterium TFI 002]
MALDGDSIFTLIPKFEVETMNREKNDLEEYMHKHYIHRSGWLRAAVLGANDGILSTASLAIGVAAASASREPIVLATLAGLVAGALSMAAGEYVSVSSQADVEHADIEREKEELADMPEIELLRLAEIYENRGLKKETALVVAKELTAKDALEAHVRDELGITDQSQAQPIQAALASGAAFSLGGGLPFLVALFFPLDHIEYALYASAIMFLIILGAVAAKAGGSSVLKAVVRVTFWGTIAMGLTALVGSFFNVSI